MLKNLLQKKLRLGKNFVDIQKEKKKNFLMNLNLRAREIIWFFRFLINLNQNVKSAMILYSAQII